MIVLAMGSGVYSQLGFSAEILECVCCDHCLGGYLGEWPSTVFDLPGTGGVRPCHEASQVWCQPLHKQRQHEIKLQASLPLLDIV